MPAAIPLIGAAFSDSAGIAAGASTLVGGLMIAGGAMTAVGTVTGNKKLQTLGAVLGLAGGGIGAFNELTSGGAFVGDAAARTAISNADSLAASAAASSPVVDAAAQTAANAASAAAPAMDYLQAADYAGGLMPDVGAMPPAGTVPNPGLVNEAVRDFGAEQLSAGMQPPPGAEPSRVGDWAAPQQAAQPVNPALQPQMQAPAAVQNPAMTGTQYDLQQGTYSGGYAGRGPESIPGTPTQGPDATGWWDRAKQFGQDASAWMKQNPETTKLAGGLIGGAANYFGQQQIAEDNMRRQMAYQDWVRQRYSDSVRNLQVPRLIRTASVSDGIIGGARG